MSTLKLILYWLARIVAAVIMAQTLYFKFTAAPESIYIFQKVGMEPWGRIGVGVMELIASVLILIPTTAWAGGVLALGLMAGALTMHLTILGVSVDDGNGNKDGGQLFVYALTVFVCALYVVWVNKSRIIGLFKGKANII